MINEIAVEVHSINECDLDKVYPIFEPLMESEDSEVKHNVVLQLFWNRELSLIIYLASEGKLDDAIN